MLFGNFAHGGSFSRLLLLGWVGALDDGNDVDDVHEEREGVDSTPSGINFSALDTLSSPPFLQSQSFSGFSLDLLFVSPSISDRLSKLNSPLSTLENESLPSLSFFVWLEKKGDGKENRERLNMCVIIRPDTLALPVVGVLSRFRIGKKVTKKLRNRRLNDGDDEPYSEDSSSRSGLKKR
jgi:hypothetical protein